MEDNGYVFTFKGAAFMSPMLEDGLPKGQDFAAWHETLYHASVADGFTQSAFAAEAARLSALASPHIDSLERLALIRDWLLLNREYSAAQPIKVAASVSPTIAPIVVESRRQKILSSGYQTTLLSVRFAHVEEGVEANILQIGDSEFFAFDKKGRLIYTTREDGWADKGVVAACLPDTIEHRAFKRLFPRSTSFVSGSDGFYTAFHDASEMYAWLKINLKALHDPNAREAIFESLHAQLRERSNDDDISFVLVKSHSVKATQ